jgi:hypothetical protein
MRTELSEMLTDRGAVISKSYQRDRDYDKFEDDLIQLAWVWSFQNDAKANWQSLSGAVRELAASVWSESGRKPFSVRAMMYS